MSEIQKEENTKQPLTRHDLWKVYFRSYLIRLVTSPDRPQSMGLTCGISPVLEKYYPDPKERGAIMKRYITEYFLTNPITSYWIIGIIAAAEEKIALGKSMSRDVISSIKTALMGPLAAIGDGLYNGTLRPIVAGVACTLAMQGNVFAPILFVIIMAAANIAIRYTGVFIGYRQGAAFFQKLQESGLMQKMIDAASIVAYTVVGAFASTSVKFNLAYSWTSEGAEAATKLNDVINGIMPNILPLALTLFTWWMIAKKRVNPILLIFIYLVFGIAARYIGLLV